MSLTFGQEQFQNIIPCCTNLLKETLLSLEEQIACFESNLFAQFEVTVAASEMDVNTHSHAGFLNGIHCIPEGIVRQEV